MDDREFYKRQAQKLNKQLPRAFIALSFPKAFLQKDPSGSESLRVDHFDDCALCGETVSDPAKIILIRKQRIQRLNRLLKLGFLQRPFNFADTIAEVMMHERFKSIHTVFGRLSDVHLLLSAFRQRPDLCVTTDTSLTDRKRFQTALETLLRHFNKLFIFKEKRTKNHQAATIAEKLLYQDFMPEIRGQNVLDAVSAKRYELFLLNLLVGFYPAFTRNFKLHDINLATDDFISGGQMHIYAKDNKAMRRSLRLAKRHADLFDCFMKFRQS